MRVLALSTLLLATEAIKIKTQGLYDTKFEVKVNNPDSASKQFCDTGKVATVQYTGKLKSNGDVFDSTQQKGAFQFVLGQAEVIECWDEGFKKVPVGSSATMECPASMAYGDVMKPGIPENSDLVFDVELLSCDKDELADLSPDQL